MVDHKANVLIFLIKKQGSGEWWTIRLMFKEIVLKNKGVGNGGP